MTSRLVVMMMVATSATLSIAAACNDVIDDLPPYSTNPGFSPSIPVGTSDASALADASSEASADATGEADSATHDGAADGGLVDARLSDAFSGSDAAATAAQAAAASDDDG